MDYKILDTWYMGRCHAPGIVIEEETDITTTSQSSQIADEEPDLDLAYNELETIKRRLLLLRGKLLITTDPCAVEVPPTLEEDASFLTSNQQQLLQLQRSNCDLKCQLQKLLQHLQATRNQMKILEALRCQLNKRLTKMIKELDMFEAFKLKAMDYFAMCIERNEQIKTCKVDDEDFASKMQGMISHNQATMRYLVPMRCHHRLHYELSVELVLMRIFLHSLFSNMVDDWLQCKRRHIQRNWRCSAILPPVDNIKYRE